MTPGKVKSCLDGWTNALFVNSPSGLPHFFLLACFANLSGSGKKAEKPALLASGA